MNDFFIEKAIFIKWMNETDQNNYNSKTHSKAVEFFQLK